MTDQWTLIDYQLPSVNEAKAAGEPDDDVEDGPVQVLIEDISPKLDNAYGPKPRRALKMRVLEHDGEVSSGEVGKVFRQYMTESTHPKSNLYLYFKAVLGGNVDPSIPLSLGMLKDQQIRGTIVHEAVDGDPNTIKMKLTGLLPKKKDIPVVPF